VRVSVGQGVKHAQEKREKEVVSRACRQLAPCNKNLVHVTASSRSCRHRWHGKCGFVINGTGNNATQLHPCAFSFGTTLQKRPAN
jgi:hypothetical protein